MPKKRKSPPKGRTRGRKVGRGKGAPKRSQASRASRREAARKGYITKLKNRAIAAEREGRITAGGEADAIVLYRARTERKSGRAIDEGPAFADWRDFVDVAKLGGRGPFVWEVILRIRPEGDAVAEEFINLRVDYKEPPEDHVRAFIKQLYADFEAKHPAASGHTPQASIVLLALRRRLPGEKI